MSRRKKPAIPNELLDQLLASGDASTALAQEDVLDALRKALAGGALNAEMDHHLTGEDGAGNFRNGDGRKTITTDTGELGIDVPSDRQPTLRLLVHRRPWRQIIGHSSPRRTRLQDVAQTIEHSAQVVLP